MSILENQSPYVNSTESTKVPIYDPQRVFVGGIPKSLSEAVLIEHFSRFGDVQFVQIARTAKGTSKGFAHVEFIKSISAHLAVSANPHRIREVLMIAELALAPGFVRKSHQEKRMRKLYLGGLPGDVSKAEIYDLLKYFGTPKNITNPRRVYSLKKPNSFYCYVTMDSKDSSYELVKVGCLILRDKFKITVKRFTKHVNYLEQAGPKESLWSEEPSQLASPKLNHSNQAVSPVSGCKFPKLVKWSETRTLGYTFGKFTRNNDKNPNKGVHMHAQTAKSWQVRAVNALQAYELETQDSGLYMACAYHSLSSDLRWYRSTRQEKGSPEREGNLRFNLSYKDQKLTT